MKFKTTITVLLISIQAMFFSACDLFFPSAEFNEQDKVVFVSNIDRMLYTQNLDGSNRKRIFIRNVEETISPIFLGNVHDSTIMSRSELRWSPNGTRIALVVDVATEQSQLIVLDTDGSNAKTASPDHSMVNFPDWSPDGTKIAYSLGTFISEIFITDLETDTWRQITNLRTQFGSLIVPRWSEDGSKIFFTHSTHPDSIRNIFAYSFETDSTEIIGKWKNIYAFARDGRMAYGFRSKIFSYDLITGEERMLGSGPNDQLPRLTDLDRQIIFTKANHPNSSAWLINTNGSNIRAVPNAEEFAKAALTSELIDIWWE